MACNFPGSDKIIKFELFSTMEAKGNARFLLLHYKYLSRRYIVTIFENSFNIKIKTKPDLLAFVFIFISFLRFEKSVV